MLILQNKSLHCRSTSGGRCAFYATQMTFNVILIPLFTLCLEIIMVVQKIRCNWFSVHAGKVRVIIVTFQNASLPFSTSSKIWHRDNVTVILAL